MSDQSVPPVRDVEIEELELDCLMEKMPSTHHDIARGLFKDFSSLTDVKWLTYYMAYLNRAATLNVAPAVLDEYHQTFKGRFTGPNLPRPLDFFESGFMAAMRKGLQPPHSQNHQKIETTADRIRRNQGEARALMISISSSSTVLDAARVSAGLTEPRVPQARTETPVQGESGPA